MLPAWPGHSGVLHRERLSHSGCGLVPPLTKGGWRASERAGEGREEGRGGEQREGGGRSFQEMMLLLVSD